MDDDRIEREITIAAPINKVWSVLTEPEHVGKWFGTGTPATIELQPGGLMEIDHGTHGAFLATVVTVNPPHTFSYRWAVAHPGVRATEDNSTLVEFTLKEAGESTLLRLVESGFASLDIPVGTDASFDSHSQGWTGVIQKFGDYVDGTDVSPLLSQA